MSLQSDWNGMDFTVKYALQGASNPSTCTVAGKAVQPFLLNLPYHTSAKKFISGPANPGAVGCLYQLTAQEDTSAVTGDPHLSITP